MDNINWFPGHMAKGRRLIEDKLKVCDLVIELVDARIPYSSKNPMISKLTKNKQRILIMTKIDLADSLITKQWQAYYESKGYIVIESNLNDFKQMNEIISKAKLSLKDKIEKERAKGKKERAIRALVIGIPNVGKSTFINKMAKRKATKVANKAGVTKALQWIKIGNDFELLDSPGLLWPKLDDKEVAINLALTGAIKSEILHKEDLAFYALRFLNSNYKQEFYKRYDIDNMDNGDVNSIVRVLDKIGLSRGCLLRNKEIDYDKVYDIILKEIKNNSITRISFDLDINKE
ncbi:MAG: ribosome biogenesis GTPase YlqF [Bacilli bacterium]|jgi:ribosome biogenesis GTPase A|nr:ribosome biogenesis GTPase YlqF [Bacilli bacterium]